MKHLLATASRKPKRVQWPSTLLLPSALPLNPTHRKVLRQEEHKKGLPGGEVSLEIASSVAIFIFTLVWLVSRSFVIHEVDHAIAAGNVMQAKATRSGVT